MQLNRHISDEIMNTIPSKEGMSAAEWLAEQMPGGFFIYRADDTMELLYVNQSTCDIYGCETVEDFRELTGNTFKGMVHPEDYEEIQSSIDQQIHHPSNRRNIDYVVYRIIRKDGSLRWVDDYGHFATLTGYGEVYYVFIEDITENRIAAEEKERVRALSYALEQAEQANNSKSAFLSNMSHEIRTPITAILGMNEMIQRETDNSVILDYSENIRKAGVSLLGIISDILDFSKIETGKMTLEHEEYSLSSLVVDLYNLVQFRAEAKGLDLNFKVDPTLPAHLVGDEIRVKQVITNILTNAVKYTEKGHVDFEITLKDKDEDSVSYEVSVTDTGIGIRNEDMQRLFEPFDRLDLKKTRTIEGTGLGLAITRQLLSIMGSELKVESRYEEGSRFSFVLTQKVSDWAPVGEFDPVPHNDEATATRSKRSLFTAPGLSLLVVDDTPMNLQVIAGLLKRTKIHIDVATSGAECIEKFGNEHYDMVFLDYRMPQMNGIETLFKLKELYPDKYEKTPIISLTASAVYGDKEKMLKAGFTDYLSKPVNIDEMERMMIKYLPQDSIILTSGTQSEAEDDELSKLPKVIFDYPQLVPEKGIEYCGDAEDYIFAIETYAMSIDVKATQIENNLKDGDLEALAINVHSLKSTSAAIGAMEVSVKAKAMEMAAKAGDSAALSRDIPVLLSRYRALKEILSDVLSNYENSEEASKVALKVVEEEKKQMLTRALAEAERANLAKTAFLSNMSHEIRTPMNDIVGLYNIALRKPDLDDDTRQIITQIGDSARHLISLINDILEMSLIESGSMKLKEEDFSFGSMLEQINTVTESKCDDKELAFNCNVVGQLDDHYIGDDLKLKQVLFNILENAVTYTSAGGSVSFTVKETERTNSTATIAFEIADTGKGIDPEDLPQLFEPFAKETTAAGVRTGNTGLGLAITSNIVDMMGGHIDVTSEKGKGSVFTVYIPFGICSDAQSSRYSFDPALLRVLIVDDDITACEHAKMILRRIGVESEYVQSGEDALSMFKNLPGHKPPFNLLLIDWKMPEMDGIELTKRIREIFGREDVAIVLTTYNWYEIMEEAFKAGVDGFLAKPMFADNLKEELGKILAERKLDSMKSRRAAALSGSRVILAEDMDLNARIMEKLLGMNDITADYASDGEAAVKLFEESAVGTYDAILMDIRMPKMNGIDATRAIRKLNRADAATIPIIALTANALDEDVRLSFEAGMNAHLAKPIEPDELFTVMKSLI
ncbi:PAS domain-containing hybrid sensor histidine kinase/response regulator [Butyrivibrio sp. FCS014]|uniref:PAS domain-containing hybrid sensor histidine kinase/response regulator n=1 Tax=Butyrivibrio sp. FCS014 TaxID=1408304 RepID=UPI000467DC27|nr:PAS domain-containing hybrid sensor histidine kinase/response regulator [Butyrivibrio sp. FCS014]